MYNKILLIMSILVALSLLTGNSIILTICFTIYTITVVMCCYNLWKGQNIFKVVEDRLDYNKKEAYKNKKYGKAFIYFITIPMVIVGIVMVILCLGCMWGRLFK